ncbi:MAG: hypothetical protein HY689_07125 [Chloroflexi bacterium]|nr:hypothetical protein [Chloroflexota bacterium]
MTREPQSEREKTAWDLRLRFDWLQAFNDDELRRISLCREDTELQPGEHYFDISHPEQGIIRVEQAQPATQGACLVAKSDVPDELWHKLLSAKSGRIRKAG